MQADPAPLPLNRVKDACVFEVTGVDIAGPVILRGGQKTWICLYTCAIYRAIHLELKSSLSTSEFLDCLRRFIGRRSRPSVIYSDNGSNFAGIDRAFSKLNWEVVAKYSSAQRINWIFNPPSVAWWGGWWEHLVGMLKNLLRKDLKRSCLNYEEMSTILCDCELTLNSRPLAYVSDASSDLKVLTPAMFLHDLKNTETRDLDIVEKINVHSRFSRKQEIMCHLRERFRNEYLSQLISKRNVKKLRDLKVGAVVLIGTDNRKRLDWPLAGVEKLILGRDNIARVAVLKTKDGLLKRPIQRVYPLEITDYKNTINISRIPVNENTKKPMSQIVEKDTNEMSYET